MSNTFGMLVSALVASVITYILAYSHGKEDGRRRAVMEWKPCAESLSRSVQELVDTYGPLLKDYRLLYESYSVAYRLLEEHGLTDGVDAHERH